MTKAEAIKQLRAVRDSAVANLAAMEALRAATCLPAEHSLGELAVVEQISTLDRALEMLSEGGAA